MNINCPLLVTCALLSLPVQMAAKSGGDAQAGRVIYEKSCRVCHGAAHGERVIESDGYSCDLCPVEWACEYSQKEGEA